MMIDGVGRCYLWLTPLLIYPGKHNFAIWVNLSRQLDFTEVKLRRDWVKHHVN